ncbi:hypothetical protein MKX64_24240 [Paenibacillus sp. FSL M8-0334]|uniref:hypothetical protein n=1 Tax=Paenibacillus sp. FSL M8-0334 TaxID=2921623 RepID=UPI0030FA8AD0
MIYEDLKPGMLVRIAPDHESGYGGRTGHVIRVGTIELLSGGTIIGAIVDIDEGGLFAVEAEDLEPVDPDRTPPGWAELDI